MATSSVHRMCLVALDIEMSGPIIGEHEIVAIGICIGDSSGNIHTKKRYNIDVLWPNVGDNGEVINFHSFDPKTWKEFWVKQPINTFKIFITTLESTLKAIENDIRSAYKDGGGDSNKFIILSNNPSFDIAHLDYWRGKIHGLAPFRYMFSGYADVYNPDDMRYMLADNELRYLKRAFIDPYPGAVHDHNPANDAEYIYRTFVAILDKKANT